MKTIVSLIVLCIIIFSCKKTDNDATPAIVLPLADNSIPSGAVSKLNLTSSTSANLNFEIDVIVFRDSKNLENQLAEADFSIDTLKYFNTDYYFQRNGVYFQEGANPVPYSALMLLDQSGSINTTDPSNLRLDAASTFCRNLGTGNQANLWCFTVNSSYFRRYPYQLQQGFTSDTTILLQSINSLRGKASGGTPLYISQSRVIDSFSIVTINSNKAILTFTDGQDTEGGYTINSVADKANSKRIKLFNVGLIDAEKASLSKEALLTGGAFMFASDAKQLISMFGNLGKLLDNSAIYYKTNWTVSRSNGNFTSGTLSSNLKIHLPYGGEVNIPFTLDY